MRQYSEPKVTVFCTECHAPRQMVRRNARKVETGESTGLCEACRYGWRHRVNLVEDEDGNLVPGKVWWEAQGWTPQMALEAWRGISLLVPSTYDDDAMKEAA